MIKKKPPFEGLNIEIPIIIHIEGRGLLIRGLGCLIIIYFPKNTKKNTCQLFKTQLVARVVHHWVLGPWGI